MPELDDLKDLISNTLYELCSWEPGAIICRQGERADALILVLDGELHAWRERGDRADRIAVVGPGELAGTAELLAPGPAVATLLAPAGAQGLRVRHAAASRLWERAPGLARELHGRALKTLMSRLRVARVAA